jgi:hypothetical protein
MVRPPATDKYGAKRAGNDKIFRGAKLAIAAIKSKRRQDIHCLSRQPQ